MIFLSYIWEILSGKKSDIDTFTNKIISSNIGTEVKDHFANKNYIVINQIVNYSDKHELKTLLTEFFGNKPVVGKFGHNSVIKVNNDLNLIFRDIDPDELRKQFFNDYTNYEYRIAFRTAEFHTYFTIIDKNTQKSLLTIGSAPKKKGAKIGELVIRDDCYYDKKYYKGTQKIEAGKLSPYLDQGSLSIEFDITNEQYELALEFNNNAIEKFNHNDTWLKPLYCFIPFFTRDFTTNCYTYAQDLFNKIGFKGNYYDYVKIDETDLHDQGIYYHFIETKGIIEAMFKNVNLVYPLIFKKAYNEESYFTTSDESLMKNYGASPAQICFAKCSNTLEISNEVIQQINFQNSFGNTLLHDSLIRGNVEIAKLLIDNGANPNICNNKSEIALFLASALTPSSAKIELLEMLIPLTDNINYSNYNNIATPLTMAVRCNDKAAVKLLIDNGANVSYINSNLDSLIDKAIHHYKSYDVVNILNEMDPTLIYRSNLEFQPPAYYIKESPHFYEEMNVGLIDDNLDLLNKPMHYAF